MKFQLYKQNTPASVLHIRFVVGLMFSERIQKFLFTNELGVGRFIKIGIPEPVSLHLLSEYLK